MDARVLSLPGSFPQALAGAVGVFSVALGVAGLVHAGSGTPLFGNTDEALLGLALNHAHNVLHLVVGVAGLTVMRSLRASRVFGHVVFFFFIVQCLYGLLALVLTDLNFLGVNEADTVMHWLLALVGVAIAWGPEHLSDLRHRRS
ncbi:MULTISPECIES: DUF4383 domain-containing protein [unclassified Blastococcus]